MLELNKLLRQDYVLFVMVMANPSWIVFLVMDDKHLSTI